MQNPKHLLETFNDLQQSVKSWSTGSTISLVSGTGDVESDVFFGVVDLLSDLT